MSKLNTILFSGLVLMSAVSLADSLSCQGSDLGVSLTRDTTSCYKGANCPEVSTLKVTCKGQNPLVVSAQTAFGAINSYSSTPASGGDISSLQGSLIESAAKSYDANVLKEYLAIILTAKTSNMPVTISYDKKSGLNYTNDQITILGVSID